MAILQRQLEENSFRFQHSVALILTPFHLSFFWPVSRQFVATNTADHVKFLPLLEIYRSHYLVGNATTTMFEPLSLYDVAPRFGSHDHKNQYWSSLSDTVQNPTMCTFISSNSHPYFLFALVLIKNKEQKNLLLRFLRIRKGPPTVCMTQFSSLEQSLSP